MERFVLVFIGILFVLQQSTADHCGSWHGSDHGDHQRYPKDCTDIKDKGVCKSGVYTIQPSTYPEPFYVYCDMDTDGGGWTVFQRRLDGSVVFFRGWSEYREGFGNVNSEFWIGNEKLFYLTAQGSYEMRVDLADFDGETRFAKYDHFRIGEEMNLYKLLLGGFSGTAGDSLFGHNGQAFSTKDSDNDESANLNCAVEFSGAWWYQACLASNLNGLYLEGEHDNFANGVDWSGWRGHNYSLKTTEMKIRRL
ncbi:ficolin-1-like [Apostichopus japonicus]|uniref:ficolin-1-like n=1 Tax=Stichopus japonicus TaxID=307972 RepID=UPI003AB6BB12